jgi:hypothetical protein
MLTAVLCRATAGCIDFWWYHGLIADEVHDGLKAACNMSEVGPLVKTGRYGVPHTSSECQDLLDEVSGSASPGCEVTTGGLGSTCVWGHSLSWRVACPAGAAADGAGQHLRHLCESLLFA